MVSVEGSPLRAPGRGGGRDGEGRGGGWDVWEGRARRGTAAACFTGLTVSLSVPLFVVMLLISPFVYALDRRRRRAHHVLNWTWAAWSTWPFYRIRVIDADRYLHGVGEGSGVAPAAVIVANHQSYLDVYALFHLRYPFKFVSKQSIFLVPFIGWSMFLTGHVMLRRGDKTGRSQTAMMARCRSLLRHGVPVCIFPEGTRSRTGELGEFKLGAFRLACETGAPIVPVTIRGTRRGGFLCSGSDERGADGITVMVHPPISPASCGSDPRRLAQLARAAIASGLRADAANEREMFS